MKYLLAAAITILMGVSAQSETNCGRITDRMIQISVGMDWCIDPRNHAQGLNHIVYGRFHNDATMVKEGYELCQLSQNPRKTRELLNFCDSASFLEDAIGRITQSAEAYGDLATKKPQGDNTRLLYKLHNAEAPSAGGTITITLPANPQSK